LADRFLPDDFDHTIEQLFRARVVVALSFSLSIFGPIYAYILYSLTGSAPQAIATLLATAGVVAGPFLLRQGLPFLLLGNWVTFCGYALFVYVSTQSTAPSVLIWQVVFLIIAALIAGKKSALGWVVVMSATTAYFYLEMLPNVPETGVLLSRADLLWEMSLIIGMFVAVLVLTLSYEALKNWALDQFRRKEAHTRAILEAAPDGIITLTEEGRIADFNPAAQRLFGYESSAIEWAPITTVVPAIEHAPPEAGDAEIEDISDGQLFEAAPDIDAGAPGGLGAWVGRSYESEAMRKNGERFPVELSVTRIQKDDRLVLIVRDISARKESRRALQNARDQAVEANEAKSRFLANISHELRTPLNAIIGYSELICEDLAYIEGPEQLEQFDPETVTVDIEKIGRAGKHLLSLINQILDLSKAQAGKMELYNEKVDILDMIDEVTETIQPVIDKNHNTLRIDTADAPRTMHVDRMKLRQILINLLSNASKFTDEGLVRVNAFAETQRGDDYVIFEVIDRGIGIPEEKLEKLFEAFQQADESTTREFGGTGLGLTICRHFTELMGGEIEVESKHGQGSTFRVKLPVDARQRDEDDGSNDPVDARDGQLTSETSDAPAGAPRVLVIDDDPNVHQLVRRFLSRQGFAVSTTSGGEQVLEKAREFQPDVITLDVLMPEVDGWGVLQQLKGADDLAHIPVIMLTIINDRNTGFSLGAADYLIKPVDPRRLVDVISSHLDDATTDRPVLIVEDDPDARDVMRRIIEDEGWDNHCAKDGQEALDLLDAGVEPCVIVLDLMMPRVDGFEFLHELHNRHDADRIPVVVVSAADLTADERQMLEQNVDKILQKSSYSSAQLIEELHAALP
jgi:signal transduction histidine kinase/DNA-binding response OmpR family regulator